MGGKAKLMQKHHWEVDASALGCAELKLKNKASALIDSVAEKVIENSSNQQAMLHMVLKCMIPPRVQVSSN